MKNTLFVVLAILFACSSIQAQVDLNANGAGAALSDAELRLRAGWDDFHYLKFSRAVDGPELAGYAGGRLVTKNYTSFVEALRWNELGFVGIGTTNMPNQLNTNGDPYRLFVKGGIKTEEVKVELSSVGGWADYVFAPDYNLLSLEEVEQHIQEKGHLHNTASAEELHREGLELKAMTVNQQEKIEELYLHLIDVNKRLKVLEQENAVLKAALHNSSK